MHVFGDFQLETAAETTTHFKHKKAAETTASWLIGCFLWPSLNNNVRPTF